MSESRIGGRVCGAIRHGSGNVATPGEPLRSENANRLNEP